MKQKWLRRVLVVVLTTTLTATGVARPTPARAVGPVIYVDIAVAAVAAIGALFGSSGSDRDAIERAKAQIISAIHQAALDIKDHMERLAIADVKTCINATIEDLDAMDDFPVDPQFEFAERATLCAFQTYEYLKVVQNNRHAESLVYLSQVIFPAAMTARAKVGIPNEGVMRTYIEAQQFAIERIKPSCIEGWDYTDPNLYVVTCSALWMIGGDSARGTRRWCPAGQCGNGRWLGPEIDQEALRNYAARNTIRDSVRTIVPTLQDSLAKLKRSFVFFGAQSRRVVEWNSQGPLLWKGIGNPGSATAVTTALAPGNARHLVTVIDGQLQHRIRNEDGSYTPWAALDSAGAAAGPVTSVTAAATPNGDLQVAAVINGQVHHRIRRADGVWSVWGILGNPGTATAISATLDPSQRFHLFAIIDGDVRHHIRHPDGSWEGWSAPEALGHPGTATALAVSYSEPWVMVAAIIDGQFEHRGRHKDGWWTDWGRLPNPGRATAVTGAMDPNGDTQYAIVVDDQVYQRTRFAAGHWNGPVREGEDPWIPVEFFPGDSSGITAVAAS